MASSSILFCGMGVSDFRKRQIGPPMGLPRVGPI